MADSTLELETGGAAQEPEADFAREDRALVEGLRAGAEYAYEALIQRFEQPVYSLVSRLVDDPADAPDVVQEVFLKVFRKVDGFRGESALKTWVYRIAVNEARNYHRWFGRHRRLEVELEPGIEDRRGPNHALPDRGPSPFEVALHQEREALVEEALGKMRSGYRAALVLREVEGLSYEEIADVLGISLGTVKSRILRGRQSLRRSLAERLNPQRPWSLDLETEQTAV